MRKFGEILAIAGTVAGILAVQQHWSWPRWAAILVGVVVVGAELIIVGNLEVASYLRRAQDALAIEQANSLSRPERSEEDSRTQLCSEADAAKDAGDVDRAESLYRSALDANSSDLDAMQGLEGLLRRRGAMGEAEALFSQSFEALKQQARNAEKFNHALACQRRGDLLSAERLYRDLLDGGDLRATTNLGLVLEQRGDVAGAISVYTQGYEAGHLTAIGNLARLAAAHGRTSEAERLYSIAAKNDQNSKFNFALFLKEQGRSNEAEQLFRELASKGDSGAMNSLANSIAKRGQTEEAEALYRKAIQLGHVEALRNLAIQLRGQRRHRESRRFYRRYQQITHVISKWR